MQDTKAQVSNQQATERQRALLMTVRQCLIMILGAVEDYLCIERSIVPQRKRKFP